MGKTNKELAVELVCAYYSNSTIAENEPFSEDRVKNSLNSQKGH